MGTTIVSSSSEILDVRVAGTAPSDAALVSKSGQGLSRAAQKLVDEVFSSTSGAVRVSEAWKLWSQDADALELIGSKSKFKQLLNRLRKDKVLTISHVIEPSTSKALKAWGYMLPDHEAKEMSDENKRKEAEKTLEEKERELLEYTAKLGIKRFELRKPGLKKCKDYQGRAAVTARRAVRIAENVSRAHAKFHRPDGGWPTVQQLLAAEQAEWRSVLSPPGPTRERSSADQAAVVDAAVQDEKTLPLATPLHEYWFKVLTQRLAQGLYERHADARSRSIALEARDLLKSLAEYGREACPAVERETYDAQIEWHDLRLEHDARDAERRVQLCEARIQRLRAALNELKRPDGANRVGDREGAWLFPEAYQGDVPTPIAETIISEVQHRDLARADLAVQWQHVQKLRQVAAREGQLRRAKTDEARQFADTLLKQTIEIADERIEAAQEARARVADAAAPGTRPQMSRKRVAKYALRERQAWYEALWAAAEADVRRQREEVEVLLHRRRNEEQVAAREERRQRLEKMERGDKSETKTALEDVRAPAMNANRAPRRLAHPPGAEIKRSIVHQLPFVTSTWLAATKRWTRTAGVTFKDA